MIHKTNYSNYESFMQSMTMDANWESFTDSIIDSTLEEQCCLNWSPYEQLKPLSPLVGAENIPAFLKEQLIRKECGHTVFELIFYSKDIMDAMEKSKLQRWKDFPNATTRQLLQVQYTSVEKFVEALKRQCKNLSSFKFRGGQQFIYYVKNDKCFSNKEKKQKEIRLVSNFFACNWFTYPMKFGPPEPTDFNLFFMMCLTAFRASTLDYHQRHVHQRCSCAKQFLSKMFFYAPYEDLRLYMSQSAPLVYNWIRVYAVGGPATPEMMAIDNFLQVAHLERLSLLYGMDMKHLHECNYCAKLEQSRKQFKVCRKCHNDKLMVRAFYCSLDCHKKDWPLHKQFHSLMSA